MAVVENSYAGFLRLTAGRFFSSDNWTRSNGQAMLVLYRNLINWWILDCQLFLSFFSLENTLQVALGKCLGTAGTLRLPLVMPYRCIAPGEKESVTLTLKYNPSKGPQGKFYD